MKALKKIREITTLLADAGIEGADREAACIVSTCCNIKKAELYRDDPQISFSDSEQIERMIERRRKREPLQYILGSTEFLGLKILIGEGVLIPRPETELMAEFAIRQVSSEKWEVGRKIISSTQMQRETDAEKRITILDLCTGSGCLALALASAFPDASVFGSDISRVALTYAKENAVINGVKNVSFLQGRLFDMLKNDRLFDVIISNPPYIRTCDIKGLQPEVRDWEPENALSGGADGMDFYKEIIAVAGKFMNDNGILMFELGDGCADDVAAMLKHAGFLQIGIKNDLAGIKRIISARKKDAGKVI